MTVTVKQEKLCSVLGSELRRIRERAGMSRQQLQIRTGIHRNSIERYEGGADLPVMTFVRLSVAMGASSAEVLERVTRGTAISAKVKAAKLALNSKGSERNTATLS